MHPPLPEPLPKWGREAIDQSRTRQECRSRLRRPDAGGEDSIGFTGLVRVPIPARKAVDKPSLVIR